MCGRFTLSAPASQLAELFDLPAEPVLVPRYNIAPTQPVGLVRMQPQTHQREWALTLWGLIPSWAKDPGISASLINARAETVTEKPAFRAAFKRRRCLVPASGFYEWQRQEKRKQPYYITLGDGDPFAIAGLCLFILEKIFMISAGVFWGPSLLIAGFITLSFIHGIRGTFAIHRYRKMPQEMPS